MKILDNLRSLFKKKLVIIISLFLLATLYGVGHGEEKPHTPDWWDGCNETLNYKTREQINLWPLIDANYDWMKKLSSDGVVWVDDHAGGLFSPIDEMYRVFYKNPGNEYYRGKLIKDKWIYYNKCRFRLMAEYWKNLGQLFIDWFPPS